MTLESSPYLVAQLGARMHYAVPRVLQQSARLSSFYTDICAVKGWPGLARKTIPHSLLPAGLRRLLGRVPKGVPPDKIRAFNSFGWEYARRRRTALTPAETTTVHLWAGETFNRLVLKKGFGDAGAVYTFNSAGLELLREANHLGLQAVVEQTIAPKAVERDLLDCEYQRYPELQGRIEPCESWRRFADREKAEWEEAAIIVCGSQFVVDGIRQAGGPVDKTVIVPYGIDINQFSSLGSNISEKKSLNVLFVGEVGIRKGAHYLVEAAQLLEMECPEIQFRLVGTIALPESILKALPGNVQLIGPIPRLEIQAQFAWADLFCLPSLCEGSATVTYEALAMGVPVICTQNTGSLVDDGKDGFLVPIRDSEAIAEKIIRLADPDCRRNFSCAALDKARNCSLEAYAARLLAVL